jgi:hypothetical protein
MVREIPDYYQQHRNERPDIWPVKKAESEAENKLESDQDHSAKKPEAKDQRTSSQLQLESGHPKPKTLSPKPDTGHLIPETRHQRPDTKHLRPETELTRRETGNSKPAFTIQAAAAYKPPARKPNSAHRPALNHPRPPRNAKRPTPPRKNQIPHPVHTPRPTSPRSSQPARVSKPPLPKSFQPGKRRHSSNQPHSSIIHPDIPLTTRQQKQWNALRDLEMSAHRAERGSIPDMKKVFAAAGIFKPR